jgi:hypothetical protein
MRNIGRVLVVLAVVGVALMAGASAMSLRPESTTAVARELKSATENVCWDKSRVDDQPDGCPKSEDNATKQVRRGAACGRRKDGGWCRAPLGWCVALRS